MSDILNTSPGSPQQWYELGVALLRQEQFGEALNAFSRAAESTDDPSLKAKAEASIDLIRSIRGFVNKDLMNP